MKGFWYSTGLDILWHGRVSYGRAGQTVVSYKFLPLHKIGARVTSQKVIDRLLLAVHNYIGFLNWYSGKRGFAIRFQMLIGESLVFFLLTGF